MTKLANDIMIAVNNAIPKPLISNELPIRLSVSISVTALMTNRNKPRLRIVTGKVRRIKNGRTRIFRTDRMKLAPTAAPNPDK